jgi:uncharacterized metal-binding protein YceD (DUF177 family)
MITHTKLPAPEFSRPIEVARVPKLGAHEKIAADDSECKALERRFKVPAVHAVTATLALKPWRGGGFKLSGSAVIDLEQQSVISLENFRTQQSVEIERYFLDLPKRNDDESDFDIDPIPDGVINIGEVVAETIALELDPYPRKPGETFASVEPALISEQPEKPNPFKALLQTPPKQ